MDLVRRVAEATALLSTRLEADRFLQRDERGPVPSSDLSRYPLGSAALWIRPQSEDEVSFTVECARASGVPIVPVGRRTAYWRPLALEGCIALDTSGLNAIGVPDLERGFIWCGAGAAVGEIDAALREHGAYLPIYPDAFGVTSIGAMLALGFSAGIGMASTTASDLMLGVRAVLGTGERVAMGAALALSESPFVREGLPDPSGLLLGSDGALGVVTSVAIRAVKRPKMAQLSWASPHGIDGLRRSIELARTLRAPGLIDTFRIVDSAQPSGSGACDLVVASPLDDQELESRVRFVCEGIGSTFGGAPVEIHREQPSGAPVPLRRHRRGNPWDSMSRGHMVGVDVIVSYADVDRCLAETCALASMAQERGASDVHHALYFAPNYVNIGLHVDFPANDTQTPDLGHAFVRQSMARLAPFPVVPYRWGRLWREFLNDKMDAGYAALNKRLKNAFDPAGILHPGASVFG